MNQTMWSSSDWSCMTFHSAYIHRDKPYFKFFELPYIVACFSFLLVLSAIVISTQFNVKFYVFFAVFVLRKIKFVFLSARNIAANLVESSQRNLAWESQGKEPSSEIFSDVSAHNKWTKLTDNSKLHFFLWHFRRIYFKKIQLNEFALQMLEWKNGTIFRILLNGFVFGMCKFGFVCFVFVCA